MKSGDTVKLGKLAQENHDCPPGRKNHRMARIARVMNQSACLLDRDLHGCLYWNKGDLVVVEKGGE